MLTHQANSSAPKRWYDRQAKKDIARSIVNEIGLPILKSMNLSRPTVSSYRRHWVTPVRFHVSKDYRMWALEMSLPATPKPVVYAGYISTQEWYITPKEAERRANRFANWLYNVVKIPEYADVYLAFICKRITSGAKKVLAKKGIPAQGPKYLKKKMIEYFAKRINALRAALAGKRIFGELALLAWILTMVLAFLIGTPRTVACTELSSYVLRVAEESYPTGPPLGDEYINNLLQTCLGNGYEQLIQRLLIINVPVLAW